MSSIRNSSSVSAARARAAFQKKPETNSNTYYPFHTLPEGKSSTFRFIPDADTDNDLGFLVERKMHKLMLDDGETVRVPCLEMYGDNCPICKTSRQYYKAKDNVTGKKFWASKDHMARALVVKDGLPPDPETGETYVGKVVTISLGKTLYEMIAHNISSGDLGDDLPSDVHTGTDFIITRTVKPGPGGEKYNDYALSKFARQSRPLEEEEFVTLEIKDEDGNTPNYIALKSLLPKKPTLEFVEQTLERALNALNGDSAPAAPVAARPARAANPIARQPVQTRPPVMGDDGEDEGFDAPTTRVAPPPVAPADDEEDDAQAFLQQIQARRRAAKG